MAKTAELNFVLQQGFRDAAPAACEFQYSALMWQPRILGAVVLVGLVLQSWSLFLLLSAVLWWNVAVPARNPFDALYNRLVAAPRGLPRLTPAPAPRRFAQAMAGSFMLGIAVSLLLNWRIVAWVLEALLLLALGALVLGKFCLGSYVFHLVKGDASLANRTLPWVRSE